MNPGSMVWDPAESRLYVANRGSYISVIRDSGGGVAETMTDGHETTKPAPTVVRGLLFLPRSLDPSIPRSLLDISGRKVLDLKPGANDVRAQAPGVYFVSEPGTKNQELRTTAKVVIAR
jgi:hypothetical protein